MYGISIGIWLYFFYLGAQTLLYSKVVQFFIFYDHFSLGNGGVLGDEHQEGWVRNFSLRVEEFLELADGGVFYIV